MALGNSMSVGKARGKGRAILVKRKKEVVTAKNYRQILGSSVQSKAACALRNTSVNVKYHYNGGAIPGVGNIVYLSKRAKSKNKFEAGNYKITTDTVIGKKSVFYNIVVNSSGVITAATKC